MVVPEDDLCRSKHAGEITANKQTVYLNNKTNEIHFLECYSDYILYMFRTGKLFIFKRHFYSTCSLWYVSYGLTATTIEMELPVKLPPEGE
jgi:hypothetical protein